MGKLMKQKTLTMRWFLLFLCSVLLLLSLNGCPDINRLISSLNRSTLSHKNLSILVLPPLRRGSSAFAFDEFNITIKDLMLQAIIETNRKYRYQVKGYYLDDLSPIRFFYNEMQDSPSPASRRKLLSQLTEGQEFSQLMFGMYELTGKKVGLRVYLYDADQQILGKSPYSGFNTFYWDYMENVSRKVTNQISDLLRRNF